MQFAQKDISCQLLKVRNIPAQSCISHLHTFADQLPHPLLHLQGVLSTLPQLLNFPLGLKISSEVLLQQYHQNIDCQLERVITVGVIVSLFAGLYLGRNQVASPGQSSLRHEFTLLHVKGISEVNNPHKNLRME